MTSERGDFGLEVSMDVKHERSPLLSAASVLHRRGIEVLEATLTQQATNNRCKFTATFRAAPSQAQTLLRSFGKLVETTDAVLIDFSDGSRLR